MKSSSVEKIFGIGYIENYSTDDVNLKTIEMDPFDIFYRHGTIGFLIIFIPIIYLVSIITKRTIIVMKKEKDKTNDINFLISLFLVLFTSTLVGHIITSPAVSIFVIIILVNQYISLEMRKTHEK